jgi:hypothetical protein
MVEKIYDYYHCDLQLNDPISRWRRFTILRDSVFDNFPPFWADSYDRLWESISTEYMPPILHHSARRLTFFTVLSKKSLFHFFRNVWPLIQTSNHHIDWGRQLGQCSEPPHQSSPRLSIVTVSHGCSCTTVYSCGEDASGAREVAEDAVGCI